MSAAKMRRFALPAAVALGLIGDWLLRVPGEPGLNVALMAAGGCFAVLLLRGWSGLRGWNGALLAAALLFSIGLMGREAEELRVFNLFAAMGTALLAAGAGAWVAHAGLSEYVRAGAVSVLALVAGPTPLLGETSQTVGPPRRSRHAVAALRGGLIATPLLLLFGNLLVEADPVFDHLVGTAFAFDPAELFGHVAMISILTWASAGYLGRWVGGPSTFVPLRLPRPQVGLVEGAVALGLLNALFLTFMLVQLRYLFGGADLVEVTPGLTYAEYARRGFFEMVAVVALVVPLQLLADWGVRREGGVERWIFRGLASGQILLLFAILGSAFYRMHLYRETYGLTELRLYTTWFMGWIAFVLVWLVLTVLRSRRPRFAIGAFTSALALLLTANVLNPHATIARVNLERGAADPPFDAKYAAALSGDAVPVLLDRLDTLPTTERCQLADRLLKRWLRPRPGGWRTFNYGDWRARVAVAREQSRLELLRCEPPASATVSKGIT